MEVLRIKLKKTMTIDRQDIAGELVDNSIAKYIKLTARGVCPKALASAQLLEPESERSPMRRLRS